MTRSFESRFLLLFLLAGGVTPALSDAENSWDSAEDLGNGWHNFSWFGSYYKASDNWIYHQYHGWLYRSSENTDSIWLYDQEFGWL